MRVVIVVAMAENRAIGRDGGIPWHVSEDLKRFKRLTTGHTIIMGRKTWESLPRRPLPDRTHVVVTRQRDYDAPGALLAPSVDAALAIARERGEEEAFVIGGGDIFRLALPHADRLELTEVHARFEGDAFFPPLDAGEWVEVAREEHAQPADAQNPEPLAYSYVTLERRAR